MNQKNRYIFNLETMDGDGPDQQYLQRLFAQIICDFDPNTELTEGELLEILYARLEFLGVRVVD